MKSGLSQAGYAGSTTASPTQNVNIVAQRMPSHSGALSLGPDLLTMMGLSFIPDQWNITQESRELMTLHLDKSINWINYFAILQSPRA